MPVSVIISNYNYGTYLADAIQSVLAQRQKALEIIVVDDGSTDESRDVIKQFEGQIVPIFTAHKGHAAALNTGFSASTGDVVIFLDADDFLLEDAVERLAKPFLEGKSTVKSQGYLIAVDQAANPLGWKIPGALSPSGDYKALTLERGPWYCRHAWTSGNAWARWFLEKVLPLPEGDSVRSRPDGCLNAVSTLFGPIVSLDGAVACYRIHGRNYGPTGIAFNSESLSNELESTRQNYQFFAEWVRRLGFTPPSEHCLTWGRSWRDNFMAYAISLMDATRKQPRFHEVVLAPLMTGVTSRPRAAALAIALALVWLSPRRLALKLSRRLLAISQHRHIDVASPDEN